MNNLEVLEEPAHMFRTGTKIRHSAVFTGLIRRHLDRIRCCSFYEIYRLVVQGKIISPELSVWNFPVDLR